MKKDYRNKGFTLVEMIVVIVIIGILLAILVPGMFRYIQKAKEQQAIVECRAVVTAAQTLAAENYARNNFIAENFLNSNRKQILSTAETDGDIILLRFEDTTNEILVTYLSYITKTNINVIYDISAASIYSIQYDDVASGRIEQVTKLFKDATNSTSTQPWEDAKKKFYEDTQHSSLTISEKEFLKIIV